MARERFWLWLGGGLAVALVGAALVFWALFGPLVFANALTAVWTCF
jgi:hypothetical protein